MEIKVLYFASLRETVGCSSQMWQTVATTVGELRQELLHSSPQHALALDGKNIIYTALNEELCNAHTQLKPGCVVAFFPPVTGG